ncbi:MAG TPA: cyanophycinase [Flavobacteriaceae bacterium]|nr:cyanophycinase [Flavobacteriaceae bacterium]MCB9212236.1 cyanophycinase [Alteromonas sp.]HPF10385.1 cyanophycinase [Flavobacteriaceae bacterium]HQU20449.1 cyanophycinase [Flavobacteriaceae bacterium]HQU64596.1 cyanophycinase [Flavobacteriaceae bacterium]
MNAKGILIPIGGNEDKGIEENEMYTLEFISEGILYHVVKEAGGVYSNIVVITTASSIPDEVASNYLDAFGKLGCKNVQVLDIRKREQCEDPKNIRMIKKAHCVMFSGGNQSNITREIGGTTIHDVLLEKYKKEPFVIAGTSAGAMCMSQEMITGGNIKEAFTKGAVGMGLGMGFIPGLIIDSHFIRRGRFGRLAEAVAKFPKLIGVGLAEDTGLIIRNCNTFEVIGSGMVVLFDPRKLKHNNEKILKVGTPMTLTNLKTHVLANGDVFNIKDRKITVLPVDAPFV